MMPDLRALFDFPRRLLPGKGARMQGYGEKQAIAGIQVTGANGVLTLSRSDKSGSMPVMGTDEQPVALRAGPGVRLHGYGGIHTLERLPLPPPEEPPVGPAILEWEVEAFAGYAKICSLGESFNEAGTWLISWKTVNNFENGSYTDSVAASGVISAYGPGETPDECDAPITESNFDPDFDSGDFIGQTYSEVTVPFTDLISHAIGALASAGTFKSSATWPRAEWQDVSKEVTPFTQSFGNVHATTSVFGSTAESKKFRLRNRGSAALRVDCGFYGVGLSDITDTIDLAPGATSAWQEVSAIDTDPAKYYTAEIRRVRIGQWSMIA